MAGEDKRIRVTADTTQLNQLRQSAVSLMRELVNIGREFTGITSGNIEQLQKEIDLLEQRNRLMQAPTSPQIGGAPLAVPTGSGGDIPGNSNAIAQILKDILDVVRDMGTKQPDDDSKYSPTGRQVRGGGTGSVVAGMAASMGSSSNIYELAAQMGAMVLGAMGNTIGKVMSAAGGAVARSGNPIAIGAGAVLGGAGALFEGLSDPVAAAVGALAGKSISLAEQHEKSAIGISQVLGGGIGRGMGRSWGNSGLYARLGMNVQEGAQAEAQILSGGRGAISDSGRLLQISRSYGIDPGAVNNLQQVSSYGQGTNTVSLLQEIYGTLRKSGATEAEIRTQMSEYMNLYSQTSEKLLEQTGQIDGYGLMDMFTSLKTATGMDVKQLNRVFESLVGANGDNNDQIKYMRMQVAREVMPGGENATPFEVMGWIQQNLSNPGFQKAFLEYMQRVTGGPGTTGYQAALHNMGIGYGDMFDFSQTGRGVQEIPADQIWDIKSRAEEIPIQNLAGSVTASSIAFSNTFTSWGEKLVPVLDSVIDNFTKFVKQLWDIDLTGGGSGEKYERPSATDIQETAAKIDALTESIQEANKLTRAQLATKYSISASDRHNYLNQVIKTLTTKDE
jgi:hypothetical protein|nr:MAG TPA: hypothetical protein [Caudoviricetes sp.]